MTNISNNTNEMAVADVLRSIAQELVHLKQGTIDLEHAIGSLTEFVDRRALQEFYRDIQFLDNLGQSLESLAVFVASTADATQQTWRIDVDCSTSKIQMRSIADRILATNGSDQAPLCEIEKTKIKLTKMEPTVFF